MYLWVTTRQCRSLWKGNEPGSPVPATKSQGLPCCVPTQLWRNGREGFGVNRFFHAKFRAWALAIYPTHPFAPGRIHMSTSTSGLLTLVIYFWGSSEAGQ